MDSWYSNGYPAANINVCVQVAALLLKRAFKKPNQWKENDGYNDLKIGTGRILPILRIGVKRKCWKVRIGIDGNPP